MIHDYRLAYVSDRATWEADGWEFAGQDPRYVWTGKCWIRRVVKDV